MSYVLNSSSSVFSGILNSVNSNYALSCQYRNLSSIPLKNLNVIIVDNDLDKKLLDLNRTEIRTTTSTTTTSHGACSCVPTTTPSMYDENGYRTDYDYEGALIYIIFILVFYSLSVILMILIQSTKSDLYHLDESNGFDGAAARNVFKRIRSENIEREALEDLRDAAWREKLWSIYTLNPNNYKIRRFESKRMQQIDRKLRQYYAVEKIDPVNTNKENHYRTFDPSQLDQRHSFRDTRHGGAVLLKDVNKFEYHHSVSAPPTPVTPSANFHDNHNTTNSAPGVQISYHKPADMSRPKLSLLSGADSINIQQPSSTRRLSNRFTVEKIKDNVV